MKKYGLYVHIPFCRSKCYYCDFYSINNLELLDSYINSIEKEIICFFNKFLITNPQIVTLYIGGGTPSLLNETQIENLFYILIRHFDFKNLKEITIEFNPESVTEFKLAEIKNLFFSLTKNIRLSLGVQSFNDKILKSIGRIHTIENVISAVKIFEKLGFCNYNFDLIFGLPGQKIKDVIQDLEFTVKFNPTHVSCYALTIEEGSYFYKCKYFPDEDLQAKMYEIIVDFLSKNNYNIYEISNFAKSGYECLHNLNYWRRKEYIGIGTSSVSFLNKKRITNVSKVEEYINLNFKYEVENIPDEVALKEKIILALRTTKGLLINKSIQRKYNTIIKKLIKEGKLKREDNYLIIPSKYKFVANQILVEFI
ncbi:MAG: radical SAM family heme chaperone HemW [Endomicrobiia bacterium]